MNHLTTTLAVAFAAFAFSGVTVAQEGDDSAWSFKTDLRLRGEWTDYDNSTDDRFRGRLRFRVGAKYQLEDNLSFGARLVTGNPDNENSTHADVGGGPDFDSLEVSLDRLYLSYQPTWLNGTSMKFGKFSHDFATNPVWSGLVWDGDIQPEGFNVSCNHDYFGGMFDNNKWNAGVYVIDEINRGHDISMQVAQFSGDKQLAGGTFGLALGLYNYGNNADQAGAYGGDNSANNHYRVWNPILSYKMSDYTFSAEFIKNTRDDDGVADGGKALGVAMKLEDGAKVYLQKIEIEADATYATFTQDDFGGSGSGGTNFNGFVAGWKKQLTDKVQLHIWGMQETENDVEENDTYRFRIDFNIKF